MKQHAAEWFASARQREECLPAFNIYNLETMQAAFQASERTERPGMIAFGEAYEKHMPVEVVSALYHALKSCHPRARMLLHLDHCASLDVLKRAVDAGFDSVMLDGSRLPLAENIALTAQAAAYAHQYGVAIEGELGGLNPEDGAPAAGDFPLTDPEQAGRFARETGIDVLAVSVGNAHGFYRDTPNLRMDLIRSIYMAAGIPLVLHGCSGIPPKQLEQAVQIAVVKINVNTEIAAAGVRSLRRQLEAEQPPSRLNQLLPALQEAMCDAMLPFFQIHSSSKEEVNHHEFSCTHQR